MTGDIRMPDEAADRGRLILVRHGESEGNRDRTFTHNSDVPLTELGEEQARRAGTHIVERFRVACIVASPYARAHHTAKIIAAIVGLPVEIDTALHEQSFGVLAGQPYEALLSEPEYGVGPRWQWRPRGGESLEDVQARVVPAIENIAASNADRDVVVVSHGGVMVSICAHALGSWDDAAVAPNGGVVVIEHRNGKFLRPETLSAP
jgi:broad specificity phosphatase PhoE